MVLTTIIWKHLSFFRAKTKEFSGSASRATQSPEAGSSTTLCFLPCGFFSYPDRERAVTNVHRLEFSMHSQWR